MNPARMKRAEVSGGGLGGRAEPVADVAPSSVAPDSAAPVLDAPSAEPVATLDSSAAPVEVKPGELDPVAAAVLGEVPDRPKKPDPEDVKADPDAQDAPVADVAPEEAPSPKKGSALLLAAGGLGLAALVAVLGAARRPGSSAPAAPAPTPSHDAPAAPAAPAARSGLVIR